jgi:hypothetical protein
MKFTLRVLNPSARLGVLAGPEETFRDASSASWPRASGPSRARLDRMATMLSGYAGNPTWTSQDVVTAIDPAAEAEQLAGHVREYSSRQARPSCASDPCYATWRPR